MFVDLAEHPPSSSQDASTGELPFYDLTQVCYSYEEVNSPNYRLSSLCSLTLQNTTVPEAQSGLPLLLLSSPNPKEEKERTEWRGQEEKEQREEEEEEGQIQQRERSQAVYSTSWRILKAYGSAYTFFITLHTGTCPVEGWTSTELPITTQTKKNAWVMVRSQNPSWIPV